jgi:tripartite-type tricarboxylate transporter receptor subunit TctC
MVSQKLVKLLQAAVAVLSGLLIQSVSAQSNNAYPERPVRLFVGFQAGAATDTLARILGQHLTERLKQPFVIENKPGAATRIAMEALSKASPDGYTLAVANAVTTVFPTMFAGMSFEQNKDFVPITLLGRSHSFVAVKAS